MLRAVMIFLALFAASSLQAEEGDFKVFAVDYDDTLSVRRGPGVGYAKIFDLPRDARHLKILKCASRRNWCKIRYRDTGKNKAIRGWINARYLFPEGPDPIIKTKEQIQRAQTLVRTIMTHISAAEPCKLNRYIHPDFGLLVYIVPSGMHPRVHLLEDICRLDSEKVTGGVTLLADPVMSDKKKRLPDGLIHGERPVYSYDAEGWILPGGKLRKNYCYMNTLEGDKDVDLILLDSVIVESHFLKKRWEREDYELADRLKQIVRYGYKVVCPGNDLVFYITLIDGKWYLTLIDFASMNLI